MLLSICMLVADPPHRVACALEPIRELAGEVVIAADSRVDAETLAGYAALADRVYRIEFSLYERHLAWLHGQCRGEWIMHLEGDELISTELAGRLPALLERRDIRQVWVARRWLYPDGRHVLDLPPWSSDHVVKLIRNDGAMRFPGVTHLHAVLDRPCEYVEAPIYHHELLTSSVASRRAKAVRYEVSSPHRTATGGGRFNEAMYLPELRPDPPLRAVPAADLALIERAIAPASHPAAPAPPPEAEPPLVELWETDRWWEQRAVDSGAYRARVEPLEDPVRLDEGELRAVFVRVVNEGTETWPWELDQLPAIRMSHHVLHADGSPAVADTPRTPFPRAVAPGDAVVVPVEVVAPAVAGEFVIEFDVVHEDVRWFGCAARARAIVRAPAGLPPAGPRLRPTPAPDPVARLLIPRVLHRVWLGGAPMPRDDVRFGETFERCHPGWTFRLWTDADLAPLGLGGRESIRSRSMSELSNLVRFEVLRRYGGVYVDTDVECRRSFEPLLRGVQAFAGLELPGRLGTAVLGCVPGHPLFGRAARESRRTVGLGAHSADANGPYFLSLLAEQESDGLTLFGQEVFYPYLWDEPERRGEPFPDAYAVHHWAKTWTDQRVSAR
jgi:hypothetical protein